MWYIEENLLPNEEIIYKGKVHWFYLFMMILGFLFWFIIFIFWDKQTLLNFIFGFAIMISFLYQILFILTTEIAVTTKRIIYKTWIIARDIFELQLEKVESARIEQSIFQRIIKAGTLIVSWTWWHNKPILYLENPIEMRNFIYKKIEENKI